MIDRAFSKIDEDQNGTIEKDELQHAMARAGVRVDEENLNAMFSGGDGDGDMHITKEEFAHAMKEGDVRQMAEAHM